MFSEQGKVFLQSKNKTNLFANYTSDSVEPTSVARPAVADELVESVLASGSVETRVAGALVYVTETPGVVVAARTLTPVAVDQVHAQASVSARVARTLVDVRLTVQSCEACQALARVSATTTNNGSSGINGTNLSVSVRN